MNAKPYSHFHWIKGHAGEYIARHSGAWYRVFRDGKTWTLTKLEDSIVVEDGVTVAVSGNGGNEVTVATGLKTFGQAEYRMREECNV